MRLFTLLVTLGLGVATVARAQQLDPAFVPTVNLNTGNATTLMALQPDGKVLLNTFANRYNGQLGGQLMRLNADGSPDVAFRARVGAGPRTGTYTLQAIAVQPDGKILVAGLGLNDYDGLPHPQPMRLNADGSLDTSFDAAAAGWTAGAVRDLAVQPDGKILVAGQGSGPAAQMLTRLLPDGSLDPTFASTTGFQNAGSNVVELGGMLLQADGKIMMGGNFTHRSASGVVHESLVRFNTDGSLDTGFTSPLLPNNLALALAQQPDGKLLVGGGDLRNNSSGTSPSPHLLRLLADGSVDPTFQQSLDYGGIIGDLRVQANGDIVACGFFTTFGGQPHGAIVRLSSAGVPDASFGAAGATSGYVSALVPLPSGQYLVGGFFSFFAGQSRDGLARLSATGQLDTSFAPVLTSAAGTTLAVPLLSGGLHLRLGTEFNGRTINLNDFHRLRADGSYDAAVPLAQPTTAYQETPQAFPQPDGTFYQAYRLNNVQVVDRLLASGTLDPSFAVDTLHYASTQAFFSPTGMQVLATGKVAVWGEFNQLNNLARPGLALLLPSGQPDPAFTPALTSPWAGLAVVPSIPMGIGAVLPQPGGRVVVLWHDANRSYLTRLLPDGSVDASFSLGTAAGATVHFGALALANGQLLVSGDFTSFGGQAAPNGLVRLLADGRPDPAFTAGSPAVSQLQLRYGQLEQPDGRLLVFTPGGNTKELLLRRLAPTGAVDTGFQSISVSSETADVVAPFLSLQPADQAIVLSGFFTHVAGEPRFGLARLVNTPLATRPLVAAPVLDVFPNPAHVQVQLRLPARATGAATLLDVQGRTVHRWPLASADVSLSLAGLAPGVYVLRVPTTAGTVHQRIVVE